MRHAVARQQVPLDHLGAVHPDHVRHHHGDARAVQGFIIRRHQLGRRLGSRQGVVGQRPQQQFRVRQQRVPYPRGQGFKRRVGWRK